MNRPAFCGAFFYELCGDRKLVFSVLIYGALCASWLLPHHFLPWPSVYQDFLVFFASLLIVSKWFFSRKAGVYLSKELFILSCLVAIPAVQFFLGKIYFFGDVVIAVFYLLLFLVAVIYGGSGRDEVSVREHIALWTASVFVIAGLLSFFIALRQWLQLSDSIWETDFVGGRPFANIGQPNNFSTLLCVSVASVFYLHEKKKLGRFSSIFISALLIFGIALSQSRTPWVSLLLGALFVYFKRPHGTISMRWIVIWSIVYLACIFLLPTLSSLLYLDSSEFGERGSASVRIDIWLQLVMAIFSGGAWGYGWVQVPVAQATVAIDHPVHVMAEHSHSILIDMLVWNGPLIGLFVLMFFSIWCINIFRETTCPESKFSLLSMLLIFVHGCLEFPLEYAYFLFPFGVFLGLASSCTKRGVIFKVSRWGSGPLLVVFCFLFFLVWRDYQIVEKNYNLMRFEKANIHIPPAAAPEATSNIILLTQLAALIDFSRFEPGVGMSHEQLAWMRKVSYRYPYPYNLFKYSRSLALSDQALLACREILVLRGLHKPDTYEAGLAFYIENSSESLQMRRVADYLKRSCSP